MSSTNCFRTAGRWVPRLEAKRRYDGRRRALYSDKPVDNANSETDQERYERRLHLDSSWRDSIKTQNNRIGSALKTLAEIEY